MSKIILYTYPPFLLLTFVQACTPSLNVYPLCSGALFALAIVSLPVWVLAFAVHVNESSADDDLFDDYSISVHIGRGRKRRDTD